MTRTHTPLKASPLRPLALALILGGTMSTAFATDGYFSHGYGMKAKGMGGASVAVAQDGFAGANNPARASFSGNRIEVGGDFFMPDRSASRTGSNMGGFFDAKVESDSKLFLVPEFGFNKTINDRVSAGLTVYGNGGMNTDYAGGQINCGQGPANMLCGSGRLGVDLMQVVLAPTVAYKLNDRHAIGVSALLVHQQFKADGLQFFGQMSSDGTKLTNNGFDTSNGLGVRLGYFGKLNDRVSIGASYSPKISMSKFSDYAGLFAEQGKLDIPENYSVGAAFQATPDVMLAVDYQRINYSGVPAIANPSGNMAFAPLGAANGPGFGWKDVGVIKLGVQWQATPKLALRAGYNKSQNPVTANDVTFNILAPGVITTHVTLGGTYALSPSTEMTVAYMHAPRQSVTGGSIFGGTETIGMSQNSLGLQIGWKF